MNKLQSIARRVTLALAAVFATACAHAQQDGIYTIARFQFESGEVMENMKAGYITWGKRAVDDSNVIVLLPATSGLKTWANAHIGPGRTFDPQKHFIVSIDAIGGGSSSQPRDGLATRFPVYNIRDMVRAQHELLTKGLGIRRALAIGGASSGAYQALEWGINYPEFSQSLLLYAPAAQADRHVKSIVDAILATLAFDPAMAAGHAAPPGGEAVRHAAVVYFPWLASERGLAALGSDEEMARAQSGFADSWARYWDATGIAWRYRSSRLHDVAAPFNGKLADALQKVKGAVLVMPVTSDRTHPIAMAMQLKEGMTQAHVTYAPLDSMRGHGAVFRPPGTPEGDFVTARTQEFLRSLP